MFVPFSIGRFTVVDKVRYGGMGEVLKAECVEQDGTISQHAIKRPRPDVMEHPELLALFWKEGELLQKVKHKAFPRVSEVGMAHGVPYMAMEFVEGVTVAELVDAVRGGKVVVHPQSWVLLAADLADAVEHLHKFKRGDERLVHGDIRMANVMVDVAGHVRLLDLGVALASPELLARTLRSRKDELAPQFLTQVGRTPELDTYSVGRLLVECLGGLTALDTARLPQELLEVVKRSIDRSGLYLFRTARSLRREISAFLAPERMDNMRKELTTAVRAIQSMSSP